MYEYTYSVGTYSDYRTRIPRPHRNRAPASHRTPNSDLRTPQNAHGIASRSRHNPQSTLGLPYSVYRPPGLPQPRPLRRYRPPAPPAPYALRPKQNHARKAESGEPAPPIYRIYMAEPAIARTESDSEASWVGARGPCVCSRKSQDGNRRIGHTALNQSIDWA